MKGGNKRKNTLGKQGSQENPENVEVTSMRLTFLGQQFCASPWLTSTLCPLVWFSMDTELISRKMQMRTVKVCCCWFGNKAVTLMICLRYIFIKSNLKRFYLCDEEQTEQLWNRKNYKQQQNQNYLTRTTYEKNKKKNWCNYIHKNRAACIFLINRYRLVGKTFL